MRSLFLKIFLWFWLAMTLVIVVLAVSGWTLRSPPRAALQTESPGVPSSIPPGATRWRQMMSDAIALHAQSCVSIYARDGEVALARHLRLLEKASGIRARLVAPGGRRLAPLSTSLGSPSKANNSSLQTVPMPVEVPDIETDIRRLLRRALRRSRAQRQRNEGDSKNSGNKNDESQTLENSSASAATSRAPNEQKSSEQERTEFVFREDGVLAARAALAPDGRRYVFVALLPATPRTVAWAQTARTQAARRASPFALVLGQRLKPSAQVLRLLGVLATAGIFCFWLVRSLTTPILQLRAATRRLARGDLSARAGRAVSARRDELGDLGHDFDAMAERIESLMSAQKRLIGDVSHELRSPLARLSIALELARRRAGDDAGEALNRIEREAERLNALIGQLLMLSRLESGAPVEKSPLDLAAVVREVAVDADYEARARGRMVRVVAMEECRVAGSEELLRSAVENVVRNAARYTAENTAVEISLRCEAGNSNMDCAVLGVRDYGDGVPEESLAHLFQPFYRAEDARDRQSGGTGLGLAITQRAVHLHGGEVRAYNAPVGGLQVEMKLPLVPVPNAARSGSEI